ncbi:DNA/RNA nuclease SfsA [Sulfitobacter sabulilitoris]|uniref:Sugar fermentation stimulation protein homolog n=1 Tax=Sulfitobacter sabulilitoris TaxID=2562655 RepID=A0A5S3PFK9_9RHOB|nr:DNA/RNA nuclease SfsA [Sulfitobacter sabulilitoris]TMM52789.1 DNA/RNA nuclease SfsA [Sulfitobacter sabulilitoris]
MRFQTQLVPARLIKRYKRFLADCTLEGTGQTITAHCANPGSMMGLAEPGQRVWLEPNDDPRKKLKFGWRLVDHGEGHFTGVDTGVPNRIVAEAIDARAIPALAAYGTCRREVRYGTNSRIDMLLTEPGLPDAYVEVKSVTLSRAPGLAEFPDSVTTRGARHLDELARVAQAGQRAVMLYLVQRTDCECLSLAADLDPAYATAYAAAQKKGVETLCFGTNISPNGIEMAHPLPLLG